MILVLCKFHLRYSFQERIHRADWELSVHKICSAFLQLHAKPRPVTMTQCRVINGLFTNFFLTRRDKAW
jgi:hypothetical protein